MSTLRTLLSAGLLAGLVTGCAVDKTAPTDDFSDLAGLDEKADAFSYRMKIVGSLDYGQTSTSVKYTKTPRFRAFKFGGSPGDHVDVWVRSSDGDAVAWVLDNSFRTLGTNDDADGSTYDAHVELTLPPSTSITHYVVFRDYDIATSHFTVSLAGGLPYDVSCHTDADCTAVFTGGCCPDGSKTAVNASAVDDYEAATACTAPPRVCPLHVIHETRVAQCNTSAGRCEMIQPEDIRCGGFTTNPHHCPEGYTCQINHIPDVPGTCSPS